MGWRSFLALVIVAAAVAGAAMTLLVRDDDGAAARGLVHLGPPASLPNIDHEPFCVPLHHFCIVQPEPGRVIALYTYDPHAVFRERAAKCDSTPRLNGRTKQGRCFVGSSRIRAAARSTT